MATRERYLEPLARISVLVALVDGFTKFLATSVLGAGDIEFTRWLRLVLVHNTGGAFGMTAGAYTWQINLAMTLSTILLMIPACRELRRIDRRAPIALGLIMGGACGNLTSLIFSSRGVVDFIAIGLGNSSELVLNVADIAAYAGLVMLLRSGGKVWRALRASTAVRADQRQAMTAAFYGDQDESVVGRIERRTSHEPLTPPPPRQRVWAMGPVSGPISDTRTDQTRDH